MLGHQITASQGAGWAVIFGFSAFFAVLAYVLQWADLKFSVGHYDSEQVRSSCHNDAKYCYQQVARFFVFCWRQELFQSTSTCSTLCTERGCAFQFNTAGRNVGAGLIAVDVVSHWLWATVILTAGVVTCLQHQTTWLGSSPASNNPDTWACCTGTYAWFYGAGSSVWHALPAVLCRITCLRAPQRVQCN